MGIVFVRWDAPKVTPRLWETLRIIAGSSLVVPANSPQVHSFECPRGWVLLQAASCKGRSALFQVCWPRGMSQGVGLPAWKASPRVEDKGKLKEETYVLISQGWG